MPFRKGYDPRRGPGKPFTKDDPRHYTRKAGDAGAGLQAHLASIPQQYRVAVAADETGLELAARLDETVDLARQMLVLIAASGNPGNNFLVGRYTELVNSCLDTGAKIQGGGLEPAKYGKLDEKQVAKMQAVFAENLSLNLTRLQFSLDYVAKYSDPKKESYSDKHSMWTKTGLVKTWAGDGIAGIVAAIRGTIERRAKLDVWTERRQGRRDVVMEAYRNA